MGVSVRGVDERLHVGLGNRDAVSVGVAESLKPCVPVSAVSDVVLLCDGSLEGDPDSNRLRVGLLGDDPV